MATKKWSQKVTETSDAMDIEPGTFKQSSAAKIAHDVEADSKKSKRKKSSDYQGAISMLTFYMNRAGKNLTSVQRKTLEEAKEIIRADFDREESSKAEPTAKKSSAKKSTAKKSTAKKTAAKKTATKQSA